MFSDYADTYDRESFTQGTLKEVDFIEKEAGYDKKIRILDIGCGTGRHAIELAKRGYSVTGVDLSARQLRKAREKADKAGVSIRFVKADARKLQYKNEFNLVIMMCEGAFPLMETDEMNFSILKNAAKALKKGGKFIFTTLNALYPLYHSVKDFINDNSGGDLKSIKNTFDLMTFRDKSIASVTSDLGRNLKLKCDERYYAPSEINWLLSTLGFNKINIYGCGIGSFKRGTALTTDSFEMLVIAEF